MSNKTVCPVCGTTTTGHLNCPYCDMMVLTALDEESEDVVAERAKQWREELVKKLYNFSIKAYSYTGVTKDGVFQLKDDGTTFVDFGSGKDIFGKISWQDGGLGFCKPQDDRKQEKFTVTYNFDGKTKSVPVKIDIIKTDSFWNLGLELTDTFRLRAFLGDKKKHTKTKEIDLDLFS